MNITGNWNFGKYLSGELLECGTLVSTYFGELLDSEDYLI